MTAKTILKERDSKPLVEELRRLSGLSHISGKSRVELEPVKDGEVVFVDGQPLALRRKGELVPVLVNTAALDGLPRVTVDMGAVPHVVGGADIMAPGVRNVKGEFSPNELVVVVDEKHGKFLAVGRALVQSNTILGARKGKVIENLHYVGDAAWETVKAFAHIPSSPA